MAGVGEVRKLDADTVDWSAPRLICIAGDLIGMMTMR
jgi:hypothetical protein